MNWLETEVGLIYQVFDQPNSSAIVDLRNPLIRLRELVRPLELEHWELQEPLDDVFLCRLLVAKDFDVEQALKLAQNYSAYRLKVYGGVRPPPAWIASGMCIIPFEDRHGRPVVVVRAKYIDGSISSEVMEQGYRASVDTVIAHCLSKRTTNVSGSNPLEQYVLMFESEGAGWSNFSSVIMKIMVRESNSHYPERCAGIYILNCNHFVRASFQMVSPMLHARTVKKIKFVVAEKVPALMQSLVEPEKLPPEYGGRAPPWASPANSQNLSDRLGRLMAATYRRLGLEPPGEDELEEESDESPEMIPRKSSGGRTCCLPW